ncbi:asparagine synthase (glutamine-hydrolysing) [Rhizobiales bacterium GAS113]|nr:asparagine synthase (glutamine-hydrolysing) [Rhizobiales bacterium GAS113]
MCGINGIYAYRGNEAVDRDALRRTRDSMAARGPDGCGEWHSAEGDVGFGHRRLSIIDLTASGAQPMLSADGVIAVTFNGEIYNYRALRRELESQGCRFRSQSDTEVLIHLYQRRGVEMIAALRGMYAFGLWDAERRRLLLGRDPYGIKPLYYADDGRSIQFASSVKALVAGGGISPQVAPEGVVGYYLFGSVPEPFTTYRAIRSIPAGTTLTIDSRGTAEPRRYCSIAATYCDAEVGSPVVPRAEAQERFRDAVLDSVRHHLVADVPVGAFLSAGVDSGSLLGLMRDVDQKEIRAVTLAFEEFRGTANDESPLAATIAGHYGATHTIRWITAQEFYDELPKIVAAMDQPSIDGINTWFVSKAAREIGLKVAISGVGGDELLGGYSTFRSLPRRVSWLRLARGVRGLDIGLRRMVRSATALGLSIHPKAAGLLAYGGTYAGDYLLQRGLFLPFELAAIVEDENLVREGLALLEPLTYIARTLQPEPSSTFGKVATLESCLYLRNQLLRDTDWAGMAHSLEVRTPLVDYELLQRVAPILVSQQGKGGKALLAGSVQRALPSGIIDRPKTGFGIPLDAWSRAVARQPLIRRRGKNTDGRLWSRDWARWISSTSRRNASRADAGDLVPPGDATANAALSPALSDRGSIPTVVRNRGKRGQ